MSQEADHALPGPVDGDRSASLSADPPAAAPPVEQPVGPPSAPQSDEAQAEMNKLMRWAGPVLELMARSGIDAAAAAAALGIADAASLPMPGIVVQPPDQQAACVMRIALVPHNYDLGAVVKHLIDEALEGSPLARAGLRHEMSTLLTAVNVGFARAAAAHRAALRGLAIRSGLAPDRLLALRQDTTNATLYFDRNVPQRIGVILRWEGVDVTPTESTDAAVEKFD